MENKETAFGLFLKDLIKKRGITQQDFYTAWGIEARERTQVHDSAIYVKTVGLR